MASGGFSPCEYDGRKAIKYYHDFGEFEFFLVQAEDGTQDISYVSSTPNLSQDVLKKIGDIAITRLKSTAQALRYPLGSETLTFNDALSILDEAQKFIMNQRA